jgi:hypothetical protein
MWRQSFCTANAMSGLVKVKYWSAPTMLRKNDASGGLTGFPSETDGVDLASAGVPTGLQLSIPMRSRGGRGRCATVDVD